MRLYTLSQGIGLPCASRRSIWTIARGRRSRNREHHTTAGMIAGFVLLAGKIVLTWSGGG
jgi:hypothetical protein